MILMQEGRILCGFYRNLFQFALIILLSRALDRFLYCMILLLLYLMCCKFLWLKKLILYKTRGVEGIE